VTFTEPVDGASLDGNVLLFERARAGVALDPLTAVPLPVTFIPNQTVRFTNQADITNCTDPVMVDQVTIVPLVPLDQKSTFTVAVLSGLRTANGEAFNPSFTWSLVREPQPVVVFDDAGNVTTNRTPLDPLKAADKAQLQGIDLLWNAHHQAITFLGGTGHQSDDLLLAFEFNTQTTTDPVDPMVAGSIASNPTALPLLGTTSVVAAAGTPGARPAPFNQCAVDDPLDNTQCFLRVAIGGTKGYAFGKAACASLGCAAISDVLGSLMLSKQYLTDVDNTLYTGTGAQPIPGPWNDPLKPTVIHDTDNVNPLLNDVQAQVKALIFLPQGAVPTDGFPTVIFQHGITREKEDVFGIAGNLASKGFAVVAIDTALHGSRAVRISDDVAIGCGDVNTGLLGPRPDLGPDPASNPQCYHPPFSTDLAATRDGFRQGLLDNEQLVTSLEACGTTACGALKVDPTKIFYIGHSLGGIYGAMTTGLTNVKAAVLNVAGAGWVDILVNTDTLEFQCPLVDGLIDAGLLVGDKLDPVNGTGLCLTDAWKTQPGFQQFAVIGRWVLDSADPANYNTRLAPTKFLLQEVEGDHVVPNIATDNLGALAAQIRGDASCGDPSSGSVIPSSALLADPTNTHYLNYITVAPGDASCPLGNSFSHGAILKPDGRCSVTTTTICGDDEDCPGSETCGPATDGNLGTARLQTDAIFFLLSNLN